MNETTVICVSVNGATTINGQPATDAAWARLIDAHIAELRAEQAALDERLAAWERARDATLHGPLRRHGITRPGVR